MVTLPHKQSLRVMIDTTILIAGIVWPRWSFEVLRCALLGKFQLVLSPYVIKEARRKFREGFPDFADDFEAFLSHCFYEEAANPSKRQVREDPNVSRDFEDVPIALAAKKAMVTCLVSEDKDLTSIPQDKLKVVLAGTFLREHLGWNSKQLEAIRHRTWKDVHTRKVA
jgi:predicted nucleic acid-binding protein